MRRLQLLIIAAVLATATGCALNGSGASAPLEEKLGGETTRFELNNNAFGLTAANLPGAQRRTFEQGDSFFTQNWVTAPSTTVARDGLGPTFNAQSCASCHNLDGRGAPPKDGNDLATRGLLVRLSVPGTSEHGAPLPEPNYGDQFQDKSIIGVPAEGDMKVDYTESTGTYADGSTYTLRTPKISFANLAFGPLAPDLQTSPRIAPAVIGMGLLEAIPQQSIEAAADADDKNGDGISGRPNYVFSDDTKQVELGRFGWKANVASVAEQAAGAFAGDIGISSSMRNVQNCPVVQKACADAINGGEPEIDDQRFQIVAFYTRVLAVPAMRDTKDDQVKAGAKQFMAMGCATCHTPKQQTGEGKVPEASNQTIYPFTDMLLHDMGPSLADGRPDFQANGQEWRTPPLWGLGLSRTVNGNFFLMHDGRARSFPEAILWHGGEGQAAKDKFTDASAKDRDALVKYLESL